MFHSLSFYYLHSIHHYLKLLGILIAYFLSPSLEHKLQEDKDLVFLVHGRNPGQAWENTQ